MATVDEVLEHFGVKGMRWGVRRSARELAGSSPDHRSAVAARDKAKKSGTKALSNAELKTLIDRMNLERQYNTIAPPSRGKRILRGGAKFAGDVLASVGKQQITKIANDQASKAIGIMLKK